MENGLLQEQIPKEGLKKSFALFPFSVSFQKDAI